MAGQYAVLKAAIEAVIKTNGNNEITGALMQQSLLAMITSLGAYYDFVDVATPSTNPGTPDQNVMYFAATAGTYTNFGGIVVNEGEFCALCWNGSWTKKTTGAATEQQLVLFDGNVLNNYFTGAGNSYVSKKIYGLIPGHKYRLYLYSTIWDTTGIPTGTNYKFSIAYNYGSGAGTNRTLYFAYMSVTPNSYYDFVVPDDVDINYFYVGGRAAAGTKVRFQIIDISAVDASITPKFYDTAWPRVLNKEDNFFAGKTASGRYTYIFPVNDAFYIHAYFDSENYNMLMGVYDDYNNALDNSSVGKTIVGGLYKYYYSGGDARKKYRFSGPGAPIKNGFFGVHIYRSDSGAITDEDITAIQNELHLEIIPMNSTAQIRENEKNSRLLSGLAETMADLHPFICNSNGGVASPLDRVKFFDFDFRGGKKVSVDISEALALIPNLTYNFGIWNDIQGAQSSASASLVERGLNGWSNQNTQDHKMFVSGVFTLYFKKSDNSAFTTAEFVTIREKVVLSILQLEETQTAGTNQELRELPVGNFTREDGRGGTLSPSTTVVSASETCVPYLGVSYKIGLPPALNVRFVYGTSISLGTASSWLADNAEITLPDTAMIQRVQFKKANGAALTLEEMAAFISDGLIRITYSEQDLPVHERNYEAEKYVKAAMYRLGFADSADITAHQGFHAMASFVHISDLHGDVARFNNAFKIAKMLGVDAVVETGDNVVYLSINGSLFLKDVSDKFPGLPLLTCIGNHEVLPENSVTETALFNNHIAPYIIPNGYLKQAGTPADAPYYYKDFDTNKVRVIVLNQYDNGCYYGAGLGGRLGQTQVSWFLNTLLSTPAGYGVIVAMHSPEDKIDTPDSMSAWNQTINWDGNPEDTSGYAANGLYVNSMRPIKTIIDAFIEKTVISTTYDENTVNGNNGETVTINADFSTLADGVEFICYLTGHRHKDNIGYLHTATNRQLCINIVCGNCHYPRVSGLSFSEGCDIPRGDSGVTQDAFNVYAIDRQNGRVKIARVGSSVNFEGIERKFLLAQYKE